ncbi:MAG: formyltetrahydrofolate deformylase [Dehalococcoidia bacterium]|nr:formyltetrahydrofolate deformylase [Dehalococcoidia bacterium]
MTANSVSAVLLLSCPDQRGLVATVADFIYRNNGNILHAEQHTDAGSSVFFQRVEWELDGFRIPRDGLREAFQPIAQRFGMTWALHFSDEAPRVAVFVSKEAHCMYDLLARLRMGEFSATVPLIVSNHPDLEPIAQRFGVEYACYPVTPQNKTAREQKVLAKLREARIDLVVLARYMQVLSEDFLRAYPDRIINIHHSFLPAFAGPRPYQQAHERGVKLIGATAHYVTAELDRGPIIEQDVARISHRDSVADLVRKGRDLEKVVLARALDLHLRHRVIVYGNKAVVFS